MIHCLEVSFKSYDEYLKLKIYYFIIANIPTQPKMAPLDRLNLRKSNSEMSRLFPTRSKLSSTNSRKPSIDINKENESMKPPDNKRKRSSLIPTSSEVNVFNDNSATSHNQFENVNKSTIKKHILLNFSNSSPSITKSHPDFNDLWSLVNKGVNFSFRNKIATEAIDKSHIDLVIRQHLMIYLPTIIH